MYICMYACMDVKYKICFVRPRLHENSDAHYRQILYWCPHFAKKKNRFRQKKKSLRVNTVLNAIIILSNGKQLKIT